MEYNLLQFSTQDFPFPSSPTTRHSHSSVLVLLLYIDTFLKLVHYRYTYRWTYCDMFIYVPRIVRFISFYRSSLFLSLLPQSLSSAPLLSLLFSWGPTLFPLILVYMPQTPLLMISWERDLYKRKWWMRSQVALCYPLVGSLVIWLELGLKDIGHQGLTSVIYLWSPNTKLCFSSWPHKERDLRDEHTGVELE